MIRIDLTQEKPVFLLPLPSWKDGEAVEGMAVQMRSTVDNETGELAVSGEVVGTYLRVTLDAVPDWLHAGEWEAVYNVDGCEYHALAQAVQEEAAAVQYDEKVTYKQYGE